MADLLKNGVPSEKAAEMLEIRQQMGKTSTKKFDAIAKAVCPDVRVRGLMQYYGASRTGRWAGRLVQVQNLPRNYLQPLGYARELVKSGDGEMLKICFGSAADTLSQLIRTALVPQNGNTYLVADYSAIEARVVAWLAGEEWVLEAFRQGKDIYCETAAQMFGVTVEKHGENSHLRQRGKVATLALGYGGGEGALEAMGAIRMGIPQEDLPEIKARWRQANPRIVQLWRTYETAATRAVQSAAAQQCAHGIVFRREMHPETNADFLTVQLPTGRKLFYARPYLAPAKNFPDRQSLHYYGASGKAGKWASTDTWGGKITENIVQAVARDCLAETLTKLDARGIPVVFHVHDEVVAETQAERLDEILAIMAEPIPWAPGLPLQGAGFTCAYYQKD